MNPFDNALSQLDKALKFLKLGEDQIARLKFPEKIISVNFPIHRVIKDIFSNVI